MGTSFMYLLTTFLRVSFLFSLLALFLQIKKEIKLDYTFDIKLYTHLAIFPFNHDF